MRIFVAFISIILSVVFISLAFAELAKTLFLMANWYPNNIERKWKKKMVWTWFFAFVGEMRFFLSAAGVKAERSAIDHNPIILAKHGASFSRLRNYVILIRFFWIIGHNIGNFIMIPPSWLRTIHDKRPAWIQSDQDKKYRPLKKQVSQLIYFGFGETKKDGFVPKFPRFSVVVFSHKTTNP